MLIVRLQVDNTAAGRLMEPIYSGADDTYSDWKLYAKEYVSGGTMAVEHALRLCVFIPIIYADL